MTNEMPKEAPKELKLGELWAIRHKQYGWMEIAKVADNAFDGLVIIDGDGCTLPSSQWHEFDWHRIELPEGWR